MKQLLLSFIAWSLLPAWAADHNALLPRPQEVRYGSGFLAVGGLSIRFGSQPGAEDRFAAAELSSRLSAIGETLVPVEDTGGSGPAITLNRTGEPAPLPSADERPGPDSRESYTLKVTPSGAEIRARSSAGL